MVDDYINHRIARFLLGRGSNGSDFALQLRNCLVDLSERDDDQATGLFPVVVVLAIGLFVTARYSVLLGRQHIEMEESKSKSFGQCFLCLLDLVFELPQIIADGLDDMGVRSLIACSDRCAPFFEREDVGLGLFGNSGQYSPRIAREVMMSVI